MGTGRRQSLLSPLLGSISIRRPSSTGNQVKYAEARSRSFIAAAERLGAGAETAVVLGDSIWDMLAAKRCKALGVGLLSGGYGSRELQDAGAIRVYEDPADLLRHIDEIGGRR